MDYEQQKRRARKFVEKWRELLRFDWWALDLAWGYDSADFTDSEQGYACVAFVKAKWEYCTATIHFNMHMLPERTDEQLELDILHELVHIPLFELEPDQADFVQHRERVVTQLTSAFQWVWQAGFRDGERKAKRSHKNG